ncbi:probable Sugar transporter STL1 [Zygosaccharomyces bailii]|nr:probable Sugar transporter STL1 [Zygosaccharomyces bailii]
MGRKVQGYMDRLFSRTSHAGLEGAKLRYTAAAVAVIGFALFGYDQGLMSGLITGTKFNEEFPATKGDDRRATVIQGAVTACYELGCFVGSLFVMFYGDGIGRKPLIIFGACITIIGTVISTCPFHESWGLGQFVVGRVVTGVGTGFNTSTIPVWQSEMTKPNIRGAMINLDGSVIALGTMIAYWLDFGFSFINSSVQWRFPVSVQIIFALVLLFGIIRMPESPRWLISKGKNEDARYVLAKLNGVQEDDDEIYAEMTALIEAVNRTSNQQSQMKSLFSNGKSQNLSRALIASSTQFFQQFTGCNAAIYYSTVLFQKSLKLGHVRSMILGGAFASVYALSTLPSFYLVEKVGRRKMFFFGALGQAISFTITFACLCRPTKQNSKGAAVGLYLFIVCFGLAILELPWIYPPEIASMRVRAATNALSTCTNWITNFAVVMFTPVFIQTSQWGCYLFFALMNFIYLPVIFFFYPETAGRSLEEIDIIFAKAHVDGTLPWRVAHTLPKLTMQEVEDYSNSLGLHEDDAEKEEYDEKHQGANNDALFHMETSSTASNKEDAPVEHREVQESAKDTTNSMPRNLDQHDEDEDEDEDDGEEEEQVK